MTLDSITTLETQLEAYRATASSLAPIEPLIEILIRLASLLKTLDCPRAICLAEEATRHTQAIGDVQSEARAWAIYAYAEILTQKSDLAYQHAQQALALALPFQDHITLGYANFVLTCDSLYRFAYGDALEAGLRAYELLEQGGDRFAQAHVAAVMVLAYSRVGNHQKAEEFGNFAIEQFHALKEPGGELVGLNNMASHFCFIKEYVPARRIGEQGLFLLRRLVATQARFHFFPVTGALFHTLAEISLAQCDIESAEAYLQEGLVTIRSPGYPTRPNQEGYLSLMLGKLWHRRGEDHKARPALLKALWIARKHSFYRLLTESTEALTLLYKKMGRYKWALRYSLMNHTFEKKRYYTELVDKMHRLEIDYEVKAARREAKVLEEKNHQLEQAYAELHTMNRTLQSANDKIQEMSIRDGLTRLYNRQHWETWATDTFQEAVAEGYPFAVFICDIDNFKRINDTWLHHNGDVVLQKVARELSNLCPSNGKAARYGGEEFVLAVPHYTLEAMTSLAERFRHRIETLTWESIDLNLNVTVSIGITERHGFESLVQQLIQADVYLYRAKHHGKNQVQGHHSVLLSTQ
jgi:diguanylate cyclase (GGDEF)-like protein